MVMALNKPVEVRRKGNAMFWRCSVKGMKCVATGMGPTLAIEFPDTPQTARVCINCFNDKVTSGEWVELT
jgi:hypothetical protein